MKLIYKEFIKHLRLIELERAYYIVIGENVVPNLYGYVVALDHLNFEEGSYHSYCGIIKVTINNFIQYWMEVMNNVVLEAERLNCTVTKDILLELIDRSIVIHKTKQIDFGKEYLPTETLKEKEIYEEIEQKYVVFMGTINQARAKVQRFDTQEQVYAFTKEHAEISLQRKTAVLEFTHTYMSLALADHLHKIRTSLEENLSRVRTNLHERHEEREDMLNSWLDELYDRNKERTIISRQQDRRRSQDLAEVDHAITKIREKIEDYQQNTPILRLEGEVQYWQYRLLDYNLIEDTLLKLKKEKENLAIQNKTYNSYRCTELPGSKLTAWQNIGENLKKRREFIHGKYINAARALLTFFAIRGVNRILYKDNIGYYNIDEFGHQIYVFDHGKKHYHVDCKGNYKMVKELDKYYYDNNGRYLLEGGEKLYQCAPCTSIYKLGEDDLLYKITKDCGHSENVVKSCKMEMKDPNDTEILPMVDPVHIKSTMTLEVVDYLWNSFARILPAKAFCDVGEMLPNNPIHCLAHNVLSQKYQRTTKEIEEQRNKVDEYRAFIFKKRKDEAIAESLAWKSNQFTRRKPEESDDTQERAVYDAHISGYEFVTSLDNYN